MSGIMNKVEDNKVEDGYKWKMLALLTALFFLMHASRQIFNAALPQIKLSLPGTSDAEWGFTRTAFLMSYGLAVPLAGVAADLFRRKWVLVIGAVVFSLSVFVTGSVGGFWEMLLMYGVLNGIGQCMIPASASSLIAQFHTKTRSTALSIYQGGLYAGVILPSAVAGWLCGLSPQGWRYAFLGVGLTGLVWAVVLCFCLRDTASVAAAGEEGANFRDACLAVLSRPSAVLLTFAFGMLVFGSNCFHTFMPMFLQAGAAEGGFALSPGMAAFHGVFWFYLGSLAGIVAGARASDRLADRIPTVRLDVMFWGLVLSAPAMAGMVYMPNFGLCCFLMFVFGVGGGLFDCALYAGLFDVVAPRYRAAAMGVYLCGAFLVGSPSTAVLGYVGQRFSYQHGMAIFAGVFVLGALAVGVARNRYFVRDRVIGG